jgi:hypothetical protein
MGKSRSNDHKRAASAFSKLSGQDKVRVEAAADPQQGTKTFEQAVKDVAGKSGSFTTEPAGRNLGVFSSGKGNIKRKKK